MSCRDCKWCNDTITRKGDVRCTHPASPWQWCAIDISCRRFTAKPLTLFDSITASPEVLAVEFVGMSFDRVSQEYRYYSMLTGEFYDSESEAIAATVTKLQEVCDETRSN